MQKPLLTIHKIYVGTYDVDFAQHVSNISYIRWLEDMRLKMFDNFFPLAKFLNSGIYPVIASTTIDYKRPIVLFDTPIGEMWISSLGVCSMKINAQILVDSSITTTASHVLVFVDSKIKKPIKLPSLIVKAYEESLNK